MDKHIIEYLLHLADTNLVLSQRNSEWCGHGPILEQDIAITNISLDLLGQARNFYTYAAELIGNGATEDSLAYIRKEREFRNLLITELPNGDWAQTILRQYFFSEFQFLLYDQLKKQRDERIAAITLKAIKETSYHVRWSKEWVIRLGDGTKESNARINNAIDELWRYTGEMFQPADYEISFEVDCSSLKDVWFNNVEQTFKTANLSIPENTFMQSGGKTGNHTENLGYILTELQYMQRAYPDSQW